MQQWRVLIILCAAQFIMVLDTTVMNVSVSSVVVDLDTTITQVQLAITLYTLVMGSFMLFGGRLGDMFGRRRVFSIGLIVYGIGSLITAFSPNIGVLLVGWSFVEGAGAVMVMPAIISLTATNYDGRDRATAYSALGGIAAAGAAAGPLIGGWVTEALTWRVVFAAETVVCLAVIACVRVISDTDRSGSRRMDWGGTFLSAAGLGLIVLAFLQSGTWGFIRPSGALTIAGKEITPFGLSVVPFMIATGVFVLIGFFHWERHVISRGETPLMHPGLLRKLQLRNGLVMMVAQQTIIGGIFFVIPIYLQYVLLKNAFETGVKLAPMSVAMLVAAFASPKLAATQSPRRMVRLGLILVIAGSSVLVTTIEPQLNGVLFAIGMAIFGAGFGFIASQLGNVIMSSVGDRDRGEAGGLQGTAQNIGTSVGVALLGALLIASLSSGFNNAAQADPNLSEHSKARVAELSADGVEIVTGDQLTEAAEANGLSARDVEQLSQHYGEAQIQSIKDSILLAILLAGLGLVVAQRLPRQPGAELGSTPMVGTEPENP
ncbi:MFS transporter [Gordonia hankookensis]|uniref:MFS transporter n=2 Tax=Gordonia hankookensis TaxID=589403 RepID=A0ABR7W5B7_9ACTN|nr:MFS transporter [Gordonia hankookensis]MBD1318022.1 MFS transporter [Gordonia hankookensis]